MMNELEKQNKEYREEITRWINKVRMLRIQNNELRKKLRKVRREIHKQSYLDSYKE